MVGDMAHDNGGSDFQWAAQMEDRTKLWTARHKLWYASLQLRPGTR
jgi:D-lactate dehydrogenase (cytochrome)